MLETRNLVTFRKEKGSTDWESVYVIYWGADIILFIDLVDSYICVLFVIFRCIVHSCLMQFSVWILYLIIKSSLKREYVLWHKGIGKLSLVLESMLFLLYYGASKKKSEIIGFAARTSYILRYRPQIHL